MKHWKPPRGSYAWLSIDAMGGVSDASMCPPTGLTFERFDELLRAFYSRFAIKMKGTGLFKLPVDDPRLPEIVGAARESAAKGLLGLSALWVEEGVKRGADAGGWFEVHPGDYQGAAGAPATQHFQWRSGSYFVSHAFLEVVQGAGLTGLGVLPITERMPKGSKPWFEVYSERALGRGLDHPLLDYGKWLASKETARGEERRWGESTVGFGQFRDDVEVDHAFVRGVIANGLPRFGVEKVWKIARKERPDRAPYFTIRGPKRFVREFLPRADFAYEGWQWEADRGPGPDGRQVRSIVCSARAREALIAAGVVKPARFEAIVTVAEADADSEVIDRTVPFALPLPVYTPEEAAAERARRESVLAGTIAPLAMPTFRSVAEAERVMKERLRSVPAAWEPVRGCELLEEMKGAPAFAMAPKSWQRLVPFMLVVVEPNDERGFDGFEMEVPRLNWYLVEDHKRRDPNEVPSRKDIIIGSTPFGDWYSIRVTDAAMPTDAKVTLWDHETASIKSEWESVLAFAAFLIGIHDERGRRLP